MNLYVLKCTNGKYYIGTTKLKPEVRLAQHLRGSGSSWTKKYKPLWILETKQKCDKYDEDKWTKKYMDKYGIENVRGGTYSQVELPTSNINLLERELNHANQKCLSCGEAGHFIKYCPNKKWKKPVNKKYQSKNLHYLNMSYDYESADEIIYESDESDDYCYSGWNCSYCNKEFTTKKGATYHENFYCKKKSIKNNYKKNNYKKKKQNICYKCGRKGHYATRCYAKRHIKGYAI